MTVETSTDDSIHAPLASEQGLDLRGIHLALQLFAHMNRVGIADRCSIEPKYRPGRPQDNAIHTYLRRAQAISPEAERAYCAILSDFVAMDCDQDSCGGPGVMYAELFRPRRR